MAAPQIITTINEGKIICEQLLTKVSKIGFVCKWNQRNDKIILVIIEHYNDADLRQEFAVFDLLNCEGLIGLLRPILESNAVLKIIHDCRKDRATLWSQFGIKLNNVYDTQIGFYFRKHCDEQYEGQPLDKIMRYLKINDPDPNLLQLIPENPEFWATRPLSQEMINFAVVIVSPLYQVYHRFDTRGRFTNNPDFIRMCAKAGLEL